MSFTRRNILAASAGAIALAASRRPALSQADKPNIVYIMADDLGYADLSCYGRRDYQTPQIDRLASQGVRLLQAYANSPVCSATRTALITGRYQYRLPVGLEEPIALRDVGLPASHPTLPSLLKAAGYGTTLLGKWHLGRPPAFSPLNSGYDHFYGFHGGALDYFAHRFAQPFGEDLWDDGVRVEDNGYLTDLLGDQAVERINAYADARQPFLISLHFNAPHWPWEGPDDRAVSERVVATGNYQQYDEGNLATYAAMVTRMDQVVGRVMATLDSRGLADNTIVVFTSDNGGERFSDTWPFSGKKMELLEGGLRIPAIVRWPARIAAGRESNQLAMSMDWLPTLLATAGVPQDPAYPTDGMDLMAHLAGDAGDVPRTLFWRYKYGEQEAVRDGNWKYLKVFDETYLFDVVADPLERANRKTHEPEVFERLVASYRAWSATMLPIDPASGTDGFTADELADHIGAVRTAPSPP